MATVFFGAVFGPDLAPRVMAAIIAVSIFGNIVVMTFTASRGEHSKYTVGSAITDGVVDSLY